MLTYVKGIFFLSNLAFFDSHRFYHCIISKDMCVIICVTTCYTVDRFIVKCIVYKLHVMVSLKSLYI